MEWGERSKVFTDENGEPYLMVIIERNGNVGLTTEPLQIVQLKSDPLTAATRLREIAAWLEDPKSLN